MDRTQTIINLAEAMGIQCKKEYKTKYNTCTGTYYCNGMKKPLSVPVQKA